MKLFKSLKICFLVILVSTPLFSLAQYKFEIKPFMSYFRDAYRYEIGVNGTMTGGTFDGVVPVYGYNNYFIGDSTLKRKIKSDFGYGATIGIAIPFAATGHISLWAFSINLTGNMYTYSDLNKTYDILGTFKENVRPLNSTTIQASLPIGIDWKVGCDAICSKRLKYGAAFGAGFIPHFNITSLDDSAKTVLPQQSIGFTPYFKAEGSFFRSTCIRLRLMYTMGNVQLMNTESKKQYNIQGYNDGPFRLTTNSQFTVSLLFMPFARKWSESAWYNTYDSYNWNERLN